MSKEIIISCEAEDGAHGIKFTHFENDEEIYVEPIFSYHWKFFKRLKLGLKYIVSGNPYGMFDSIVWGPRKIRQAKDFLNNV